MRRRNYNILFLTIIVLVVCVCGIYIAYAALSTSIETKFGDLTQQSLKWDVGFISTNVDGVPSNSITECGTATVNKNTVTGINMKFHTGSDKCTYTFTVENNGDIDASIISITPKNPTNITCSVSLNSIMICGNITYKLRYDSSDSENQPRNGDILAAKTGSNATTRNIILTAEYTGDGNTENFSQNGFGFTINYGQH